MLWGKKDEELPEALRGKTPEQIAEILKKAQELEGSVTTLTAAKSELEGKLTAQATEFEDLRNKVTELEASQKPPVHKDDDEPPSIWTDPEKFVDGRLTATQQATLYSGMLTAKMFAQNSLSARDRKIWAKYEKEIDKTMEAYTPQQRIMPQSWLLALTVIKGQHDTEIAAAESSRTDFFSETAGGNGNQPPDAKPPEDKLSPEEEEVCRKMHWKPEGYLKQKKAMQTRQSEKGGYAHFGV